jgi:hypothetical protein
MSTDQMMQSFEKGGELDSYQDAGQTQPSGEKSNTKPDPNAEILVTEFTGRDGKKYYGYYKGNQKIIKDSDGNVVETRVRPAAETSYSQYGLPNIKQILDKTPGVTYSEINFGSFGRQSPMGNTGIYLSSTNSVARSRGDLSENEWNDFKKRHGDWIDIEYEGGFEQFKKDLLKSKAVGDKAAEWFQNEIDKKSIEKFGVSYFSDASTSGSSPYKRDGKFGMVTYSVPRFFNPAPVTTTANSQVKPPPAQSPTQTDDKQEEPAPMRPRRQGPWWLQDIVNFTGALTDRVNRYEPTQSRIDLQTPGYALLDPTRQLAANQEQMARLQDQAMNTTDGNVAMASMLGASGQGFGNAANVLADIENRNIGIVNRAYMGNAQIENQEAFANENARQKYVADMATLNQQVDNANQQKKWRQIAAFNNGTTNWFRKKQMEQVLFPQVYIDPIMGDAEFSGQGRDFFGPDTYLPAYMTPGNTNLNPDAVYKDAYDRFLPEVGDSQAKKLAERAYANALLQQSRQFQGTSPQQNFNWMAGQGLTLPAPLGRQEYGGEMYLPWVELD